MLLLYFYLPELQDAACPTIRPSILIKTSLICDVLPGMTEHFTANMPESLWAESFMDDYFWIVHNLGGWASLLDFQPV